MPHLVGISIYPIKSLDPVVVNQATLLRSGALKYDREFAIVDQQGRLVNGKRTEQVHGLRSQYDLAARTVALQVQGREGVQRFHLDQERDAIAAWLSDYFGFTVQLIQNLETGFPDDLNASGPTVISTATLETVASWFSGLTVEEMRLRLRSNLEIAEVPPFWEDQLFAGAGSVVEFQMGDAVLAGVNPCQRCIVPARDALTGGTYPAFQKTFIAHRRESLPPWTNPSRFNHFYRLAVNTKPSEVEVGKTLRIGDEIKILGIKTLQG